jgi:hypothetical protein
MLSKIPVTVNGVAADLCTKYPKTEDRLVKAVDLINRGRIKWVALDDQGAPIYECLSSDGSMVYTIHAGACTCIARKLCYHRIARGILTILAANKTAVAFREALALEDEEPPTPTETHAPASEDLNQCGEHPVFVAPVADELRQCGEHRAFVPPAPAKLARSLTNRYSMAGLGKLIAETWKGNLFTLKA